MRILTWWRVASFKEVNDVEFQCLNGIHADSNLDRAERALRALECAAFQCLNGIHADSNKKALTTVEAEAGVSRFNA